MSDYPPLNTQVIGQAESALGAMLEPLLAGAGITFQQWLVLTVTAASGGRTDRGQLVARISGARKVDGTLVESAIAELAAAGLVTATLDEVALTDAGRARYDAIRAPLGEVTTRLYAGLSAEDLATAGRVLTILTARANAELAPA